MASQQQIYETKILLNSEQAKKEINALEKKIEDLKRKRQEALDAGDTKSWQKPFSPSRRAQEAAARTRKNVFLQRKSSF